MESVVDGVGAKKFGNNRIDGGSLVEGPQNCRGVVASWGRCLPGGGGSDGAEDSLLEDQCRQFYVRFGDGAFGFSEADQLMGDVGWPLDDPGVVLAVFVLVYPYPPGAQAQSVGVAEVRTGIMDQLCKVGGAVINLGAQVAPELDVLVELGREVGRRTFCSSGTGEGNLHRVEVPDGTRHDKVHVEEITDEALQILDGYKPLAIRYLQKGDYL